jgi:hypothetical protein
VKVIYKGRQQWRWWGAAVAAGNNNDKDGEGIGDETTMKITINLHSPEQRGTTWRVRLEMSRRCCQPVSGGDNDDNDVRWEEQDMPYADTDALSYDWRQAEGEEGNVDNGDDDKYGNRSF